MTGSQPDPRIAATVARASRTTRWEQVGEVPLRFDAHHPQGMVRVDGTWWITTVDLTAQTGWLLTVDDGGLVDRTPVGDPVRFHPGGLDFDGEALWVASAEYRPRSTSMVERVVPGGGPELVFGVDDHVGAIARLGPAGDLVGWTWGSRRFLRWTVDGTLAAEARHPSQFVDFQDGQWVGDDLVLCGGVGTVEVATGPASLGGIGLLRGSDLAVTKELPFPGHSPTTGRAATQNPLWAEVVDDRLVLHLLPDDGHGALLSYATALVG